MSSSAAKAPATLATFVSRRILLAFLTLLLVSIVIFGITAMLPGDAADEVLGQNATPEAVAALRRAMGLDQSATHRYLTWLSGLLHGNPGMSLVMNAPVSDVIGSRLANSAMLASIAALFAIPVALATGAAAAASAGDALDRALSGLTLVGAAVPEFLVGTVLVMLFSVQLGWFPSLVLLPESPSLWDMIRNFTLPVLTLSIIVIAQLARMTRATMLDELTKPYAQMAVLKGLSRRRMIWSHVLPNCVGPLGICIAFSLSTLLGSTIIVETLFSYPGLASLMVNAVASRDIPLLQACAMIFAAAYLLLLLVADIVGILSNPRLRAGLQ